MRLPAARTLATTLLLLLAGAELGCAAAGEDVEGSSDEVKASGGSVLALGDSITFGWDPLREPDVSKVEPGDYVGYAEVIAKRSSWSVSNTSCPGEASGSLLRADAEDNGCDSNRAKFSLHTSWQGRPTQIEAVESLLRARVGAGNAPSLITMTIGGNDLVLLQKSCTGFLAAGCMAAKLPILAHRYEDNLKATFAAIARTGYRGPVVALTTYAPDYSNRVDAFALSVFNEQVRDAVKESAREHDGVRLVVADAFEAFKKEADRVGGKTCETGLLIAMPDGSCDIHPSPKGHELLADTVLAALAAD